MAYIDPRMVQSPKGRVKNLKLLADFGEGQYAVAEMLWDDQPAVGVRWNGGDSAAIFQGLGNPQSRGIPTWFILPEPLAKLVLDNPDALIADNPHKG